MRKKATHNSVTGEEGSFLSKFLTPFARCQSKTLVEQYMAGCRLFDIRFKKCEDDYYGAHGLWRTKEPLSKLLLLLNEVATDNIYISITYEGTIMDGEDKEGIIKYYYFLKTLFPRLTFGSLNAKYADNNLTVDWVEIKEGVCLPKNEQGFLPLDGRHWQTYIPLPWLWDRLYTRNHEFNDEIYEYVDFL